MSREHLLTPADLEKAKDVFASMANALKTDGEELSKDLAITHLVRDPETQEIYTRDEHYEEPRLSPLEILEEIGGIETFEADLPETSRQNILLAARLGRFAIDKLLAEPGSLFPVANASERHRVYSETRLSRLYRALDLISSKLPAGTKDEDISSLREVLGLPKADTSFER